MHDQPQTNSPLSLPKPAQADVQIASPFHHNSKCFHVCHGYWAVSWGHSNHWNNVENLGIKHAGPGCCKLLGLPDGYIGVSCLNPSNQSFPGVWIWSFSFLLRVPILLKSCRRETPTPWQLLQSRHLKFCFPLQWGWFATYLVCPGFDIFF